MRDFPAPSRVRLRNFFGPSRFVEQADFDLKPLGPAFHLMTASRDSLAANLAAESIAQWAYAPALKTYLRPDPGAIENNVTCA